MIWVVSTLGIGLIALLLWHVSDRQRDARVWTVLVDRGATTAHGRFDPAMVADLPEAAQRYFHYMILPDAPICPVAEITMQGRMGLGTKLRPNYKPMRARQVLAPPFGLVWQVRSGLLTGSDGACGGLSWTRFWMGRFVPVVRVGGTEDHARSAFGRVVAEAAFWAPASLLPSAHVHWEEAGPDIARAVVTRDGQEQAVKITLAATGQPVQVRIDRWSNANPDRMFRLQPFGGTLGDFREVSGYRLPFCVDGGNHFGTDAYFPFFQARVTAIRLLPEGGAGNPT